MLFQSTPTNHVNIWGKIVQNTGKSKGSGRKGGSCLPYARDNRKVSVAGAEGEKRKVIAPEA